jgi:hypothetical protein
MTENTFTYFRRMINTRPVSMAHVDLAHVYLTLVIKLMLNVAADDYICGALLSEISIF